MFYFSSFFFLLLQTTLLHYAKIYGVIPNLLITLTIVTALVRSSTEALRSAYSGLCIDMQFGTVLGFYALLGMYAGMAAGIVSRRIYRENVLVVVPFTFVYSIIYESVVFILNNIMTGNISFVYAFTRVILPEAIYNCAVSVLLFPLLVKAGKWFDAAGPVRKY